MICKTLIPTPAMYLMHGSVCVASMTSRRASKAFTDVETAVPEPLGDGKASRTVENDRLEDDVLEYVDVRGGGDERAGLMNDEAVDGDGIGGGGRERDGLESEFDDGLVASGTGGAGGDILIARELLQW